MQTQVLRKYPLLKFGLGQFRKCIINKNMPQTCSYFASGVHKLFPNYRHISLSSIFSLPQKHLIINPLECLHDEPISIKVKDLSPGDYVTLTSAINDIRGQTFFTCTHYIADDSGGIDLSYSSSLGGSYKGVFPMGPIAALSPGPAEHKYLRFLKKDVEMPLLVKFELLKGHLESREAYNANPSKLIDCAAHKRMYMAAGVERIHVEAGNVRGTLFLPAGEGPFPGVVDMFGTAGGLLEFRSAQLASRGVASLALPFFAYGDLPPTLDADTVLNIKYFEESVNFLLDNEKVKKMGIGAIGVSKGADLACSMGTFIPELKAVVSINGIPVNTFCPLQTKHKLYPSLNFELARAKIIDPNLLCSYDMMNDSDDFPDTHLPMHESNAQFLFLVSLDDQNWKSEAEAMKAVERMRQRGFTNFEILKYDGAGHLLEPCYSPFTYASYHKGAGTSLVWGGKAQEHTAAQVDSWSKILACFKTALD